MSELVKYEDRGLTIHENVTFEEWLGIGETLKRMEGSVLWWIGDWLRFGEGKWGEMYSQGLEETGKSYNTLANAKWVSGKFQFSRRREKLEWSHHREVAGLDNTDYWLDLAESEGWSHKQLRANIKQQKAIDKTGVAELKAEENQKYCVLYADPPWRYEHPPIGASNRSIENHYPTMSLEEICALPVGDVANENCVLFMWATSPKLAECMEVLEAWGFEYRTNMVWVKDKIGMGYHAREKHELLLIAKRGELAPPAPSDRPDSVIEAPRLAHSAKPPIVYDVIDRMYPTLRKLELFARSPDSRDLWSYWGNQAKEAAVA